MERRPIYLNFFTIRFPITAFVSILHRASGVLLFFLIPLLLWALEKSLRSESSFEMLKLNLSSPAMKCTLFILFSALIYHLLAGVRHLLMDVHMGDSKIGGRWGSIITLGLSLIIILWMGIWIFYV